MASNWAAQKDEDSVEKKGGHSAEMMAALMDGMTVAPWADTMAAMMVALKDALLVSN